MNPVLKALFLGLLNYLVYSYIILPVSSPTMDELEEEGLLKVAGEGGGVWREEELIWFIQISDLHISRYVYPDLQEDLREFLTKTVSLVRPRVMLVSGDLTDAKGQGGVASLQQPQEWQAYRDLIRETGVTNQTLYLDIRGNHDTFDTYDYRDKANMHLTHSVMGPEHQSSYLATIQHGGTNYSFVAVDASLNPGPKKVFNFLGQLTPGHLETLEGLKTEAELSDHQVYFGHFPLSCIVPSSLAKSVVRGGLAYLSGHLHTLGGLAPRLYSMHRTGTPELELGDWKENRMWRLLAIDNGLLSFSDQRHGQDWPVVLVTNPKDAAMAAPGAEVISRILASSHMRVLVFSWSEVTSVLVKVDSEEWQEMARAREQGVYTLAWDPQDYTGAQHTLRVMVTMVDDFGETSTKEIVQKFVVDTASLQSIEYNLYARLILMADVYTFLQCCWLLASVFCLLPPVMARLAPERLVEVLSRDTVTRLRLFCSNNFLFYLYVLTGLYITFGPWHIGEILTGHVGFIFPWGTLVRGSLLPSFYIYIFSLFHLLAFHTPLLWSLLYKLELRATQGEESRTALALSNIPVTLVLSMQACMLLLLYLWPSHLGIFKEVAILLAPVEIVTIVIGFSLNGVVSYKIRDNRRSGRRF